MSVAAVKVLPAPVAIRTNARGRSLPSDASSPSIAFTWQSRRRSVTSGGMSASRARSDDPAFSHACTVSGRWNANTRRERWSGSARSENRISVPDA